MKTIDAITEILKREGVKYLPCFPTTPVIEAAAEGGIRPIVCRQERVGVGIADGISRVSNGKYMLTPRGVFELKYFFSSGVAAADGEGASSEAIKARIKALCDGEDPKKVLSDQKLADLLNAEGFDLARRTVAKYREAIGIGSSAQRRRQKKLAAI